MEQPIQQDSLSQEAQVDREKVEALMARLHAEQNLPLGIVGGIVMSVVGAVIWAAITASTHYQIGYMAVGVGFLVGMAVRKMGRGTTAVFGYAGALLALFGCALGNLLSICVFIATEQALPAVDVIAGLDPVIAGNLMYATFEPIDMLFYGIAVYEGYRLSFRTLTDEELQGLMNFQSEADAVSESQQPERPA